MYEDLFYYDETSKSCIRWKRDIKTGRNKCAVICNAGDEAGTRQDKYWVVGVNGKQIKVHLIVMQLHGKSVPPGYIVDHRDRDMSNNCYTNLQVVLRRFNMQNRSKCSNNSSGVTGVSWDVNKYTTNAMASWRDVHGKKCCKRFNVKTFGVLPAFKLACDYRDEMLTRLNLLGMKYSEKHGK